MFLYAPLVKAWLTFRRGRSGDVDDLPQKILTVVRALGGFNRLNSFRTWLGTITLNWVRDPLR